MRTVRLFHWRASEAETLITMLREAGYRVLYRPSTQAPSVQEIKDADTFAIVIDLSRLPSHGRNVGAWVRGSKSIRHTPLVFAGGDPAKVAAIRLEIPDGTYVSHTRLISALKRLKRPQNPVVPMQMMHGDPQRTTAQKLGVRDGMTVGLIDPPSGYARVIGELPGGVNLEEDSSACPMTLWFVHDPIEFATSLRPRRVLASNGPFVDRVAERTPRRLEWQLRARVRAWSGTGGLQNLLAG